MSAEGSGLAWLRQEIHHRFDLCSFIAGSDCRFPLRTRYAPRGNFTSNCCRMRLHKIDGGLHTKSAIPETSDKVATATNPSAPGMNGQGSGQHTGAVPCPEDAGATRASLPHRLTK